MGMVDSQSYPSGELSAGEATARRESGGWQIPPEGLGEPAPGPALAAFLSTVSRLAGGDAIRVLRVICAQRRRVAHYQAEAHASTAEAAHAVSPDTAGRGPHPNPFAVEGAAAGMPIRDCAPHLAQAATDRVNRIARSLKTCDETRTIDQLRADVAIDLLICRLNPDTGGRGSVNVCVDLTTLARLDDNPAEHSGYGPVISDVARKTAESAHGTQ